MPKYKLICFDMDGVIFSSENIIYKAYQNAATQYNIENEGQVTVPNTPTILQEVGKPVPVIFQNLFPQLNQSQQSHLSKMCLDELIELVLQKKGLLYPQVDTTLSSLKEKGVKIALASNGRSFYLEAILEAYQLEKYFDVTHYVDEEIDGSPLETKTRLIVESMKDFKVSTKETLMVGDRITDQVAAKEANVDFAAMLEGHSSELVGSDASYFLHSLSELIPII